MGTSQLNNNSATLIQKLDPPPGQIAQVISPLTAIMQEANITGCIVETAD